MRRLIAFAAAAVLTACGGGGSTPASVPTPPIAGSNAVSVVVEAGPGSNVNIPYVSVTVCVPGTSTCQTIDHVLVDTGSTGLRLLASSVSALHLPAQTTSTTSTLLECAQFLNFVTWGPVKLADIAMGGERGGNVPVQLVADPGFPIVPHSCTVGSTVAASASDLGANGILGVGSFLNDGQMYHGCAPTSPFSSCRTYPTATQQVQNPVARFATNNNGVLLKMDAVAADGATRVTGQLIFGIGTQSNNQLGTARIVPTDSNGYFTTTYKGTQLPNSFFDSGSNGLYFDDPDLTACTTIDAGFYCPASLQNLSATVSLAGNTTDVVHFSIGDAAALLASPGWAFSTLGGSMSGPSFDWGLPFFFGRSVFTAIEGRSTPAGVGPLFAYTP